MPNAKVPAGGIAAVVQLLPLEASDLGGSVGVAALGGGGAVDVTVGSDALEGLGVAEDVGAAPASLGFSPGLLPQKWTETAIP